MSQDLSIVEHAKRGGRPSKLSEFQLREIHARLLNGERASDLAREFDISPTRISRRFSQQTRTIKNIANELLNVWAEIQAMPVWQQKLVRELADEIKAKAKLRN